MSNEDSTDTQNIRRMLSRLRTLWSQHAPSKPMFLGEELESGVTVSDFCVTFLVSQRSRRVVRTERGRDEKGEGVGPSREES